MAKSILQENYNVCYFCGSTYWLEEHHIFGGGCRKISEREGFKVRLCHFHHNEPPKGVHFCEELNKALKRKCQIEYERTHTREEFMWLIGRSYL